MFDSTSDSEEIVIRRIQRQLERFFAELERNAIKGQSKEEFRNELAGTQIVVSPQSENVGPKPSELKTEDPLVAQLFPKVPPPPPPVKVLKTQGPVETQSAASQTAEFAVPSFINPPPPPPSGVKHHADALEEDVVTPPPPPPLSRALQKLPGDLEKQGDVAPPPPPPVKNDEMYEESSESFALGIIDPSADTKVTDTNSNEDEEHEEQKAKKIKTKPKSLPKDSAIDDLMLSGSPKRPPQRMATAESKAPVSQPPSRMPFFVFFIAFISAAALMYAWFVMTGGSLARFLPH